MAKSRLGEQISDAVWDSMQSFADSIAAALDEVVEAVEDVLAGIEREAKPLQSITVNTSGCPDPEQVAEAVIEVINQQAKPAPSQTGGRDEDPSLRDTLSTVYKYMDTKGLLVGSLEGKGLDAVLDGYKIALSRDFLEHVHSQSTGRKVTYTRTVDN